MHANRNYKYFYDKKLMPKYHNITIVLYLFMLVMLHDSWLKFQYFDI